MKNTLQTLQKKRKSKKGFTLMEMLIVVAIIAILVAIAIPVFSAQMTKAKQQVDTANLRSAASMAVVEFLTDTTPPTTPAVYVAVEGEEHTMEIKLKADFSSTADKYYFSQENPTEHIEVTIATGGKVTDADWVS